MPSWDDATFFNRVGVMQPRTGPVGVPGVGGLNVSGPLPIRTPSPPTVNGGFAGRPAGPVSDPAAPVASSGLLQNRPRGPMGGGPAAPVVPPTQQGVDNSGPGAPSEVTLKFHAPPEPPPPAEQPPNPLGTELPGQQMLLNEQGAAAYAKGNLRAEELYGPHPFMNDPHAPQPKLLPGVPNYNPFSASWS